MNKFTFAAAAAAAAALTTTAPVAAQTVDGTRDTAYGAAKSIVTFAPGTTQGDFANPTPFTEGAGYRIYLTSTASSIFGFLEIDPLLGGTSGGSFANLYFDVNSPNNGSDLGFEITNGRAFVPGVGGYSAGTAASPLAGLSYAIGATGIEFSLANQLFTGPITGAASGVYGTLGDTITLRLSQSFGLAVAGGPLYGDARLGSVTLGGNATAAVPEPATWGMMILGFGMAGFGLRNRRKQSVRVTYA